MTRTEYDGLGRATSEWVGTDDVPASGFWSVANLAGTDMVKVREYEYDGGGVGDSPLVAHDRPIGFVSQKLGSSSDDTG